LLAQFAQLPDGRYGAGLLGVAQTVSVNSDTWKRALRNMEIEGFVVNDSEAVLGERMLTFSSCPTRPKGCYKLKPTYSEDVVAYAVRMDEGVPASFFLKQRLSEEFGARFGEWFACGRVGLHESPELINIARSLIAEGLLQAVECNQEGEALPIDSNQGVSVAIEFAERLKSRKFRHSVIPKPYRFRHNPLSGDYKPAEQCYATTLLPEG
jgi:hypothetical protein